MSDTKKSSITDKEYREIYNNMSKERLIELLIADKRELRRLRGMWLEQKQANEANKQPDTEALRLQNVNPRLLFDKGLEYAYALAKESHVDENGELTVSLDVVTDVAKTFVKHVNYFLNEG